MSKPKQFFFGREFEVLSKKKKILWFMGMILMLACFFSTELYLRRTMEAQTDSDISSELVLANLLAEEGEVVSSNWYYSTELRILNTNLVFAPLFHLFHSWHIVRLIGTVIIHFCLLLSLYIFCRSTKILSLFPIIGLMSVLPLSDGYYSYILKFPYYVPHLSITLLVFSIIVYFSECEGTQSRRIVVLFLGCILAVLAGMGGARQVIVFFLPLFISVLVPCVQKTAKVAGDMPQEHWKKYLFASFLCLAAGLIGYLLNLTVLKGKYHFKTFEVFFVSFDAGRISTIIAGFLQSLGFVSGKIEGRVLLHNMLAAFIMLGSVLSAIEGIRVGQKRSNSYFFFSSFYISSILIFFLIYLFTDMDYFDRYNLPIIFLAAPVIAMGLKYLNDYKILFRAIILVTWMVLVIFCGYSYLYRLGVHRGKTDYQDIADFLTEHGYYKGYSTFWNANILTELSDGAIDVYVWGDHLGEEAGGDVDRTYTWLQLVKHDTERPEGKVFLLFQNNAIRFNMDPKEVSRKKLWKLKNERIIFKQGNYTIYGYENYEDMISDIYDYDFVFQEGDWLVNGEDRNGVRILYEGGISRGPYIQFRPGRYQVTVCGNGLLSAEFASTYGSETGQIDIEIISKNDQKVVYEFVVSEKVDNGETLIKNVSGGNIEIQDERIDFLSIRN